MSLVLHDKVLSSITGLQKVQSKLLYPLTYIYPLYPLEMTKLCRSMKSAHTLFSSLHVCFVFLAHIVLINSRLKVFFFSRKLIFIIRTLHIFLRGGEMPGLWLIALSFILKTKTYFLLSKKLQ